MKIKFFVKPFIWLILICYGLFLPSKDLPVKQLQIPHFDKIIHFGLFFVLGLLLFRPFKKLGSKYMVWAPLSAAVVSTILESVQHTISSTRNSNIYDLMANISGILFSILVFHFLISGKKWEIIF